MAILNAELVGFNGWIDRDERMTHLSGPGRSAEDSKTMHVVISCTYVGRVVMARWLRSSRTTIYGW